jgi:hypothetical protein
VSTSPPLARFLPVALDNSVTLDYMNATDMGLSDPQPQHYAFLVSGDTFDAAFARVAAAGIGYHADPTVTVPARSTTTSEAGEGSTSPTPMDTTRNC